MQLVTINYILLIILLLIVSITDIKLYRIPNKVLLLFLSLRSGILVYEIINKIIQGKDIINNAVIIFIIFIIGMLIRVMFKDGVGFGDIKLLMTIVVFVNANRAIKIIYNSIIIMGVIDLVVIILRKKTRKDAMPFAPAVFIATMIEGFRL